MSDENTGTVVHNVTFAINPECVMTPEKMADAVAAAEEFQARAEARGAAKAIAVDLQRETEDALLRRIEERTKYACMGDELNTLSLALLNIARARALRLPAR